MDSGNTAWVLASAALVLFMTPGLAFFYGGMVRAKNMLAMLMQNFFCMGLVSVLWVLVAFSLAFGPDVGGGLIGDLSFAGLKGLMNVDLQLPGYTDALALTIPPLVFVVFQMMFAIITPGADHRGVGRPHEVRRLGGVPRRLADPGLLPGRPLGLQPQRVAVRARRPRLRRRHRRPHQRRDRRPGPRHRAREAEGLAGGGDAAPRAAVDDDRRRHPVVRVVRLQRRIGPGRQQHRRHRLREHQHRGGGGDALVADRSRSSSGVTPRRWAGRRAWWRGWWPSPPAPAS